MRDTFDEGGETTTRSATLARSGAAALRSVVRNPFRLVGDALVWAWVAFILLILFFVAISSVKTSKQILGSPWSLPKELHWQNFVNAWQSGGFGIAFLNTVLVAIGGALVTVTIAAPAAYGLSRFQTRSAGPLITFFAMGMGIPVQVLIIPLYIVLAQAGLINSRFGLVIVYVGVQLPFTVFLLTGFFRSLPRDMEEAAALDGCTPWQTLWRIMLPLARNGLVTALIIITVFNWNETFLALILLQSSDKYTLSLNLLNFYQTMTYTANWGGLFAGVTIVILPILLLFIWLRRYIIEGLTLGAGK